MVFLGATQNITLLIASTKKTLLQNGYPRGVLCFNINHVLNRQKNKPAEPITTVPKKDIFLVVLSNRHF